MKHLLDFLSKKRRQRKRADLYYGLRLLMKEYPLLEGMTDAQFFDVNQRFTSALMENEYKYVELACNPGDDHLCRYHHHVADQLREFRDLRNEIREIYLRLEQQAHIDR